VAMGKKKKHTRAEIATKLAQANDLTTEGKLQSDIARTLGVSVMTLHRWRKAPPRPQPTSVVTHDRSQPDRTRSGDDRIAELHLENSRLRRLVTDLLLRRLSSKKLPRIKNLRGEESGLTVKPGVEGSPPLRLEAQPA
jgi:putative transposase